MSPRPNRMHARWTSMASFVAITATTSCIPPDQAPPPYFTPQPPHAPQPVDPGRMPPPAAGNFWNRPPSHHPAPPSATTPAPRTTEYPLARKTGNPEEVTSPYPPNHRINISGFESGQLARDPYTGKIFRIP